MCGELSKVQFSQSAKVRWRRRILPTGEPCSGNFGGSAPRVLGGKRKKPIDAKHEACHTLTGYWAGKGGCGMIYCQNWKMSIMLN